MSSARSSPNHFADHLARRFRTGAGSGAEQSLFGTVAQIAGIFLGLYFTAVSAIAAAVYADVPGEVRLVLLREKVGNVYIRTVAFLGAFALILLSAITLGVRVGLLNVAVTGVLSALSIFAFVVLGLRAFNFFSPDTLVGYLIADIVPLIDASQRGSFGVANRAIPYNYQRRAEDLLGTLQSVIRLSSSRQSVTARSLLQTVRSIFQLVYFYASKKARNRATSALLPLQAGRAARASGGVRRGHGRPSAATEAIRAFCNLVSRKRTWLAQVDADGADS